MKDKAIRGVKWLFSQQAINQVINYSSIIILAALVDPNIHGFITIASIPIGFVGVLGTLGVKEKIVKSKEFSSEHQSGLFAFILTIAFLLFIISIFFSILVAWFYKDNFEFDKLIKYSFFLSLITPIGIINQFFESLKTRKLAFKGISFINVISLSLGVIISVLLAYFGFDYLGLSLKLILPHMFYLLFFIIVFKPSLNLKWYPDLYSDMKTFSTFLTFNNIVNYFVRNIDYLVIGKFFNADILGQYTIAYKILLFPMKNITSKIQVVALPFLSKLEFSYNNFKNKYFLILASISLIVAPLMTLISLTSDDFVSLVFNYKYNLLASFISVLAIVGFFQSITSPVGILYILKEDTKLMFRNSVFCLVALLLCFIISSSYNNINLVLLAYSYTWVFIVMPISLYSIFKRFDFKIISLLKVIFPSVISSVISYILTFKIISSFYYSNTLYNLIFSISIFLIIFLISYVLITRKKDYSLFYFYNSLKNK